MDTKKIGAFIAANRKAKGLTQEQLAEKLGVTNKTISRWETGKYMPDLSLLQPLSEELGISLNELLSGEQIETGHPEESTEPVILNTITYFSERLKDKHRKISWTLMTAGALVSISSFIALNPESSWSSIYSVAGLVLFITGLFREMKFRLLRQKIAVSALLFLAVLGIFFTADYIGVVHDNRPPIYRHITHTLLGNDKIISYFNPFYRVHRINADSVNEYYIIDRKKEYTPDTVPHSPFNRTKSGIDNIIKYRNKYIGNNSNDGNLLNSLPLSEYGFVFEIDSENCGLIINYHTTDWYDNENLYIQKSLLYNSVAIFALIDNAEYITYQFSGNSYTITREAVQEKYPDYDKIGCEKISAKAFNRYLEDKMNDSGFVKNQFQKLFS